MVATEVPCVLLSNLMPDGLLNNNEQHGSFHKSDGKQKQHKKQSGVVTHSECQYIIPYEPQPTLN
ncbi:hypothetical protein E2C01_043273 [Portunus trituberculatus]|uniref:Uncharacterized protein n=1 Tax=Portunus trituberculatus TaxID=210409 RepID=A0A5B7FPV3_PORTR|nr:hypothetical protein [Portunus trituberculatus]